MSDNVILFPSVKCDQHQPLRKVPTQVRHLACVLIGKLQINTDTSLVACLGRGDELSNQSAIETWLLERFGEDVIRSMQSPLEPLSKELTNHLNNCFEDKE